MIGIRRPEHGKQIRPWTVTVVAQRRNYALQTVILLKRMSVRVVTKEELNTYFVRIDLRFFGVNNRYAILDPLAELDESPIGRPINGDRGASVANGDGNVGGGGQAAAVRHHELGVVVTALIVRMRRIRLV